MTDQLRNYLNLNIDKIENEAYKLLQQECPPYLKKELRRFLLQCSDNDYTLIQQSNIMQALQEGVDKYMSDVHICHVGITPTSSLADTRHTGWFEYIVVINGQLIEGNHEYNVMADEFPRAQAVLRACGKEFAEELKSLI